MSKVYLVSAKRSAIGTMLGTLKDVTPTDLGAKVLKAALEAGGVKPEWLDEVVVGNVLPAGVKQGPARQVAIGAGVPVEIPAYSLNMVCGSGMKAVMNAVTAIKAGRLGKSRGSRRHGRHEWRTISCQWQSPLRQQNG